MNMHVHINSFVDMTSAVKNLGGRRRIEKHQLKASLKAIERAKQAMVMKFSGGMG